MSFDFVEILGGEKGKEKSRKRRKMLASRDQSRLPHPHALPFPASPSFTNARTFHSPTDFFASATKEGRATGDATATRRAAARPAFLMGAAAATGADTFKEAKATTGALAATTREEEARRAPATAGAEARTRRVVCMVLVEGREERAVSEEGRKKKVGQL